MEGRWPMTEQQMPARIWADEFQGRIDLWTIKPKHKCQCVFIRADLAERMAEALEALVRINEEHNEAISQIIGHPLNWKDDYLDQARSALFAFMSATQDTEARHD
jgi:hypothetical protein